MWHLIGAASARKYPQFKLMETGSHKHCVPQGWASLRYQY